MLFLESICKGQKKFGHSLGPSVDKKNEFPQMIVIHCNAGYLSYTPQVSPPPPFPPISDKMLTVLLLKPSATKPGMGPAGSFGLLLFFNRTSHFGLDTKNLFVESFGCGFEPGSSNKV